MKKENRERKRINVEILKDEKEKNGAIKRKRNWKRNCEKNEKGRKMEMKGEMKIARSGKTSK